MSNKGDQLRGELLLSSRHLLSGNVKVNCQEYRLYTATAAIQSLQGCWKGGKLMHHWLSSGGHWTFMELFSASSGHNITLKCWR